MQNIETEIIGILEKNFYAKEGSLSRNTVLEDIIKDSMDFVELVALLTTKYGNHC